MSADLAALLALYTGERATAMYDEIVTEREHTLQAAALAEAAGADDATVAAALLHDVGRLLVQDQPGDDDVVVADRAHDRMGEHYLARWFDDAVTAPVGLHVEAKRYLCATERGYLAVLSPVSVRSLAVQGGPMSPEECARFRTRPAWSAGVALRRWDDRAKSEVPATRTVEDYRPLLEGLTVP